MYGLDDHTSLRRKTARAEAVHGEKIAQAIAHLRDVEAWWNKAAEPLGLPTMDVSQVVGRLERNDYDFFADYFDRVDDSGVLHDNQIVTIVRIIALAMRYPTLCGQLLGALQAGKTLTAIACQWLGAVHFLMTGEKVKPIYLISNQISHEVQTRDELDRFVAWYGNIKLCYAGKARCSVNRYNDLVEKHYRFYNNPTLTGYRREVIGSVAYGDLVSADFLHRRVPGDAIDLIAEICGNASDAGVEPLLIIDESQYGASDPDPALARGKKKRCVLRQILDAIHNSMGSSVRYILVSATPWETNDLASGTAPHLWKCHMALSANYVGFNFFGGEAIDEGVTTRIPNVFSFAEYGGRQGLEIPLMRDGQFDFRIWALQHKKGLRREKLAQDFNRWARKSGYRGSYQTYVRAFEEAVHEFIRASVREGQEKSSSPIGICVRLCNDNYLTRKFIAALRKLRCDAEVELLEFFADNKATRRKALGSVKRFLAVQRTKPQLPYVMFVTNKARMGDAFPNDLRYFLEMGQVASNLNALLQGLLGRACGFNKETNVIMSSRNAQLVIDWVFAKGNAVWHTSRHSIPTKLRRGPKSSILKLTTDMDDPMVQAYLARVAAETVDKMVIQDQAWLRTHRAEGGTRYAPILKIADEMGLFDYIERNQSILYPQYHTPIKIARADTQVMARSRKDGRPVIQRYVLDSDGNCTYTFRHSASARGGRAGRGSHTNDVTRDSQTDRARVGDKLEPQCNVEKFDRRTGLAFDDSKDRHGTVPKARRKRGHWRLHMLTLPLVQPVQEVVAGKAVYPIARSPMSVHMSDVDRQLRDEEEHAREERRRSRRNKFAA